MSILLMISRFADLSQYYIYLFEHGKHSSNCLKTRHFKITFDSFPKRPTTHARKTKWPGKPLWIELNVTNTFYQKINYTHVYFNSVAAYKLPYNIFGLSFIFSSYEYRLPDQCLSIGVISCRNVGSQQYLAIFNSNIKRFDSSLVLQNIGQVIQKYEH